MSVDRFSNRHPDRTFWCERKDFPPVRQPTQAELDQEALANWKRANPWANADTAFQAGIRYARS